MSEQEPKGQDVHPSHVPRSPMNMGINTGVVYCRACGWMLWSSRGPSLGERAYESCVPTEIAFRAELEKPGAWE